MNETFFESSSNLAHRPEELGDIITGISAGTGGAVSNAAPSAGGWPPGIVPEMTPGFLHHRQLASIYLSLIYLVHVVNLYFL